MKSPVVVAVDGSQRNRSAIAWAAAEAERRNTGLVLVRAVAQRTPADDAQLAEAAHGLSAGLPEERVTTSVLVGRPEDVLCTGLPDAAMLVVGRRGLSALPRMLVGSTSLAVAGRSPVPVVVVPDPWEQSATDPRPLTVGVNPSHRQDRLLEEAFTRAGELGVPLVAVHGWEAPSSPPAAPTAVAELERAGHEQFEEVLEGWRKRFPEVRVRPVTSRHHPAVAVLDAADAQLLVLGRRADSRFSGFGFGSVTRAVLHYADCPVLVVPTD